MSGVRVLLDANVLYPVYLRDLLAEFGVHGFYRPLWSNEILHETQVALDRHLPAAGAKFPTICDYLNDTFPDAEITHFAHLIGELNCSDPDDNHVLAAAIVGGAGALVTYNGSDFPGNLFPEYGIELRHPDDFLQDLSDLSPTKAIRTVGWLLASYSRPALRAFELAQHVQKLQCPGFASFLLNNERDVDDATETILQRGG